MSDNPQDLLIIAKNRTPKERIPDNHHKATIRFIGITPMIIILYPPLRLSFRTVYSDEVHNRNNNGKRARSHVTDAFFLCAVGTAHFQTDAQDSHTSLPFSYSPAFRANSSALLRPSRLTFSTTSRVISSPSARSRSPCSS
jgi:hypothetical protein